MKLWSSKSLLQEQAVPALDTFWCVEPHRGQDGSPDINFRVMKVDCPQDQRDLKSAVERTITVIKSLYLNKDEQKLEDAFVKLIALSQVGLVGANASPAIATDALKALEADIVEREAGPIKNAYMKNLGVRALVLGITSLVIYVSIQYTENLIPKYVAANSNYLLVWAGCMSGTWASFASRKVNLSFFDLAVLEEDRVEPQLRLVFSGILTIIMCLVFSTRMADVKIGEFLASKFVTDGGTSLLLGAFAGMSEKALPSAILSRATRFVNTKSA